jgi:hypothetical protein
VVDREFIVLIRSELSLRRLRKRKELEKLQKTRESKELVRLINLKKRAELLKPFKLRFAVSLLVKRYKRCVKKRWYS